MGKLNVRNAIADEFDEYDDSMVIERLLRSEEDKFDDMDCFHESCHFEWQDEYEYNGCSDKTDELWEVRENSIKLLNEARKRLISIYELAGIDPTKECRTRYYYESDGTRIRKGYRMTIWNYHFGGSSNVYPSFEQAIRVATNMVADAVSDKAYPNGYVDAVTYDIDVPSDNELKWYEKYGYVEFTKHAITFGDGIGWKPENRIDDVTTIEIEPAYVRY